MKYIIVSILIILLLVLVYRNKETFTGSIIKQNLNEITDALPDDVRYKKLISEITDQLKTDFNKGTFFSENIDKDIPRGGPDINKISEQLISDKEIQNSITENLKNDYNFKTNSKGDTGDKGDSGNSTEHDVLKAGSLKIGDQIINETKLTQMLNFFDKNKNLIGNKLIINPSINEKKAQEVALADGTTLVPKLNLGGNIMAKDGEFIKIENGFVNKLKINNQEISTEVDKLFMNNVNITSAEVNDLLVKDNNLDPGPVGEKGDTGPQGWGIKSGVIVGDKVIFTNKGGDTFNVNIDKNNPIDNLYGPRGYRGDKGAKGDKGPTGLSATEGEISEDGKLTLAYNLDSKNHQGRVTFTGDKLKGDTGPPGKQGDRGLKGDRGEDITDISLRKDYKNKLRLYYNGRFLNGRRHDNYYKVLKGNRGIQGAKGIKGKDLEVEGIENTKDELLFNKDINTNNQICFDDDQYYCVNNDTNYILKDINMSELLNNLINFLGLDSKKKKYDYDLEYDIEKYYKHITNKDPEDLFFIINDLISQNYINKVKLCVKAEIDVLNNSYEKIKEYIDNMGEILKTTTMTEIINKDETLLKNTYLRIKFEEIGFIFNKSLTNDEFFTKLIYYTKILFGKKKGDYYSDPLYYGIEETNLNIDTFEKKKNLLNIFLKDKKYKINLKKFYGKYDDFFNKTEDELTNIFYLI
jgi:hypothetical protein